MTTQRISAERLAQLLMPGTPWPWRWSGVRTREDGCRVLDVYADSGVLPRQQGEPTGVAYVFYNDLRPEMDTASRRDQQLIAEAPNLALDLHDARIELAEISRNANRKTQTDVTLAGEAAEKTTLLRATVNRVTSLLMYAADSCAGVRLAGNGLLDAALRSEVKHLQGAAAPFIDTGADSDSGIRDAAILAMAGAVYPQLFSDDADVAHRAASPMTVAYARQVKIDQQTIAFNALMRYSGSPTDAKQ